MAMRSVGSSVAKARFGQLFSSMKRLWVEEVEQKPGQAILTLAGGIMYGFYKCDNGLRKIVAQHRKERMEYVTMRKRLERKTRAFNAELVDLWLEERASLKRRS